LPLSLYANLISPANFYQKVSACTSCKTKNIDRLIYIPTAHHAFRPRKYVPKPKGNREINTDATPAGTNPIHNKKPKKKPAGEEDDETREFKAKQQAGIVPVYSSSYTRILRREKLSEEFRLTV
jgi:hypothetical protein